MIYVCIPSYNEAPTVGLVLWKIRRIFEGFPREYQLLVVDDGSTDNTAEVLEPYTRALPLTVMRHPERHGYARSVEELLREALDRSDRPKRDAAILMHADFAHSAEYLPEMVKRLESGADLVATRAKVEGEQSRGIRWVRQGARWLLGGVKVPGSRDVTSGFGAFRLIALKNAFRAAPAQALQSEGWAANAELFARVAQHSRRVEVLDVVERHDLRPRPSRLQAWTVAKALWRDGRRLRVNGDKKVEPPRGSGKSSDTSELQEASS